MEPELSAPEAALRSLSLARRAHEFVAHELLVLILSGRFRAGDRLPPERALAAEFGVSRPTIRQAVAVLAAHGLVEARVGAGTFVVGTSPVGEDTPTATAGNVSEVAEARLVFEVGAVRLAARRARRSREELDLLGAMVEALEQAEDADTFPVDVDVAFHRAVLRLADNTQLEALLAPFWATIASTTAAVAKLSWTRDDTARIAAQHRAVYEALRVGDAELAAFEMERHLRTELARLTASSAETGPPARFFA
jgi:GntR family transcriptional regulator, transcriptional repressor for pyruvate dehydrogenase complex